MARPERGNSGWQKKHSLLGAFLTDVTPAFPVNPHYLAGNMDFASSASTSILNVGCTQH